MKPWKRIEPTTLLYNGWRKVSEKTFVRNDGKIVTVEIGDPEGMQAVAVIAITRDKRVVIARQFRCGAELVFDELPGGAVDKGETPEQAVIRELEEEAAYTVGDVEYLGKTYKHAYLNTVWHFFLATDCQPMTRSQHLDGFEEIEVDLITIDQLIYNAKNARMSDPEAVFFAYDTLLELKEDI